MSTSTVPSEGNHGLKRKSNACLYCREKKVKCNGSRPCAKCQRDEVPCVFVGRQARRGAKRNSESHELKQRMEMLEQQLLSMVREMPNATAEARGPSPSVNLAQSSTPQTAQVQRPGSLHPPPSWGTSDRQVTALAPDLSGVRSPPLAASPSFSVSGSSWIPTSGLQTSQSVQAHGSLSSEIVRPYVLSNASQSWPQRFEQDASIVPSSHGAGPSPLEDIGTNSSMFAEMQPPSADVGDHYYTGMLSYLSICSQAGREWVAQRCSNDRFKAIADLLLSDSSRQVAGTKPAYAERALEPDATIASAYTQAFFEKSPEAPLVFLSRSGFESRLKVQPEVSPNMDIDDPAWWAIRNTVYAAGCRVLLSRLEYSSTFAEAQNESWKYFKNALSVLSELLYPRFDLEAIRALLLMSAHATALRSPTLDHMLICAAMRLAQICGLHRKIQPGHERGSDDYLSRCWLFWSVYSLEKSIAFSHGIDSVIDDDMITCPMPQQAPGDGLVHMAFLSHCVAYSKIASAIIDKLKFSKLSKLSPDDLTLTLSELKTRLEEWRQSLPDFVRPSKRPTQHELPSMWNMNHAEYLRCAYHAAVLGIHSVLAHPWTIKALCPTIPASLDEQIEESARLIAETSRDIIMNSNGMDIDASVSTWQELGLPTAAAVNVFIYVLKDTNSLTSLSDVALLDVVVGHLGHLDFVRASDVSSPVVRELAHIARTSVKAARGVHNPRLNRNFEMV